MKHSILRVTLPLVVLSALAACGDSPETLFAKAKDSFAAEDYDAARLAVASALADEPGNTAMLELLVDSQLRLGDPDGAEGAIGRYERAGGKGPRLALMKANVALLRGKPKDVLGLLGNAGGPEASLLRAEAHVALGQDAQAIAAFDKGMAQGADLRLAEAYARFRIGRGDMAETAAILRRIQALAPKSFEAMVLAGDLAAARGDQAGAIPLYKAVIEAYPERTTPMLALANQYDILGKVDEAAKVVAQAEKIAPDAPGVQDMKIQLMAEKGEWSKIRDALQAREHDLVPGSGMQMKYAEALLRLGHPEQARMLFNRAALAMPGNPYSRMMQGEAELATGDAASAWATLKPIAMSTLARPELLETAVKAARAAGAREAAALAARLDPLRLKATMELVGKGDRAVMQQDWPAVLAIYGKLAAQGEDSEVLKRLALASSKLGRGGEAIGYADRALALSPGNPDYLYLAGLVRLEAGQDIPSAQRYLEAAASADPQNVVIAQTLEKAKAATG